MSDAPKYGKICSFPVVCCLCGKNYGPKRGLALLQWCLGCNRAVCPSCLTEQFKATHRCADCHREPEKYDRAYIAGMDCRREAKRRFLDAFLGAGRDEPEADTPAFLKREP